VHRALRLVIIAGLAGTFAVALLLGLRGVGAVYAGPGLLYVDGGAGQDTDTCGNAIAPCRTISYTLHSRATGGDTIRVAQGVYTENLAIDKQIALEGGYEPLGWTRNIAVHETVIDGLHSRTVWGDWDGEAVHCSTVLSDGGMYKMWYEGLGPGGQNLGLATSPDGTTWTKYPGNPVLTTTAAWEGDRIGQPHVIVDGPVYKMWYGPGDENVGYAWSDDGVHWAKYTGNPILEGTPRTWDEGGVGAPFVVKLGTSDYRLWYQSGGQIGYAFSVDGVAWTKHITPVLAPEAAPAWDDVWVADPNVLFDGSTYHMWYAGYNGDAVQIGYASSSDGMHWVKSASNPLLSGTPGAWDAFGVSEPNVLFDGVLYRMWFSGWQGTWETPQRGYATSPDGIHWAKHAGNPVLRPGTPSLWGQPVVRFAAGSDGSVLDGCTVRNGEARSGGGILIEGAEVTIRHCTVVSNTAYDAGGGIGIVDGARAIASSNRVLSNTVSDDRGSGVFIWGAEVLLDGNLIARNVCADNEYGNGAIGIEMTGQSLPVTVTNNVVVSNTDKGVLVGDGVHDLVVVNNTIASNRNEGIQAWGWITVSLLRNNIISSNGACGIAAAAGAAFEAIDHNDVWQNGGGDGNYCDYGGAAHLPAPGAGEISSDPLFADAVHGDYSLRKESPCVDAGTPVGAPATDIAGIPRDAAPDIGAYEWVMYRILLPLILRSVGP
jgi:predicted GH43/DUF377 family glycosyl hydrolase